MKYKFFLSFLILSAWVAACTSEKHHSDEHKKYRVIKEDSTQKTLQEDHMHDNLH